MMATVPHVISGLGLKKFQADGFLLTQVYIWGFILYCFPNDFTSLSEDLMTLFGLSVRHLMKQDTAVPHP